MATATIQLDETAAHILAQALSARRHGLELKALENPAPVHLEALEALKALQAAAANAITAIGVQARREPWPAVGRSPGVR